MENKSFNVGGSIERATRGDTGLSAVAVLQEAFTITNKTFLDFLPPVMVYFLAQLLLLAVFIEAQLGNALQQLQLLFNGGEFSPELLHSLMLSGQFADVLSAPVYLAVSLMAINHAVGLPTGSAAIWRSLPRMVMLSISTMMLTILLQTLGTMLFFPLGLFLSMALSFVLLLISTKRIPLQKAIQFSLLAAFRHAGQLVLLFSVCMILFWLSAMSFGLGLLWALPFFFNVKAVVFRILFGITLKKNSGKGSESSSVQSKTTVFDA